VNFAFAALEADTAKAAPNFEPAKRPSQVRLDDYGLSLSPVGVGPDAPQKAPPPRSDPDASGQNVSSVQIPNTGPQRRPTRRSSQEIDALDAALGATAAAEPAHQFVESAAGSDIEGDSIGRVTDTPEATSARSTDLPGDWSGAAVARDISAQPALPISAAQDQTVAPNGFVISAAHPTDVQSSVDSAGAALPDISALNSALASSWGMDADPDTLIRPIATVTSPVLGGEAVAAPVRGAAQSDDPHRIISVILPTDASSLLAGSNTPSAMESEGSANSASSTPSPTGLADQLSNHVIKSVDNGGGEVVLQLHPPKYHVLALRSTT
jgi:hypothetical protein